MTDVAAQPPNSSAAGGSALSASLRERHVAMIALGGVIGAGLFVGSGAAILSAGPVVVVSYALAGTLAVLVMRMLGEMAVARPGLGSFNAYIRAALGPRAAFISGWLYWYFWIIAVGAETIAGATLLAEWVALPVPVLGLVLVALLTASNLFSVRSYGEFEFWFSLLKVLAIIGFVIVAGGFLGHGHAAQTLLGHGGLAPKGWLAVLGAIPTVIFSMTGTEIASIAAAESDDPAGNVAKASRTVALRITLFYVAAIALIVATVPWSSLESGHSPFVAAMAAIGIPRAAELMQGVILVAVLSCLNSGIYVTSRVLRELAAKGDAPGWLVAVDRRQVPARAILLAAAAASVAAVASMVSPGVVFAFLLDTSGAVVLFVYLLIALAQIRARQADESATLRLRMWLFPGLSWAAIAGIVLVFVAMAVLPEDRVQLGASAASVAMAAGAAWAAYRGTALAASS